MTSFMLLAVFLAQASAEPDATPEQLAAVFDRFCLRTGADRTRFDAEIAIAPELQKTSTPSLFSGVEFNRRWTAGAINLAFLDAPAPAGRSCAVTATARDGFDGKAIAVQVAKVAAVELERRDGRAAFIGWTGTSSNGATIIVNNRTSRTGFGDVEIILRPISD